MTDLSAAWDAYNAHPTTDTLNAWLAAAYDWIGAGNALPDAMAGTYRLATGAQGLPVVTITEKRDDVAFWSLALSAAALALVFGHR